MDPKIDMNPKGNLKNSILYNKAEKQAQQPKGRPAINTQDVETTTRCLKNIEW